MINSLVKFPLWANDGKPGVELSDFQKENISVFLQKVEDKEYNFVNNPCLCGNTDTTKDILVTAKDRYGIACDNVLCENCGLIRIRERLDDESTAKFYNDEYRYIYVGKEVASDKFFNDQLERGRIFFDFVARYTDIDKIETVFEIGCGAGGILQAFGENNKRVTGCDFGEKYLVYGKQKGLDLYQGEIDVVKTPKNSQDLIILAHVMEHLNDPVKTINEIIEFIKPGKFLLIEVPGILSISKTYFNSIDYFQNAHVHSYYYYYLKVFFESLGLKVVYGNETCTFLLEKPLDWIKRESVNIEDKELANWSKKIEKDLKKYYLLNLLKLNPYYYKQLLRKLFVVLGLK